MDFSLTEEQVLAGLKALGDTTPSQLVPGIYVDVPRFLWPVAERSVLAHLIKLRDEGRAVNTGESWRLA